MIVLVLTAVPPSLRGVLTRWLIEIAPGVYVGKVSARVRDLLWERVVDGVGRGRAILVHSARNEQGLDFRVHNHEWHTVDYDGISLMLRPHDERRGPDAARSGPASRASVRVDSSAAGTAPRNWSYAERRLRGPRAGK